MSDIDLIRKFKTMYMDNLNKYSDYNDSLYQKYNYEAWNENLQIRSKEIRKMYVTNKKMISKIDSILDKKLNDDIADEFYSLIKTFKDNEIHDASIMIKIINKLIEYYEPKENYKYLLNLYAIGALEEMEFFIRMDNNSIEINPLLKYQKIIDLKSKYKSLNNSISRRTIFMAYYNLIGPLADLNISVRENTLKYYKEAVELYNSDIVKSIDENNEDIKEEMYLINDVFITSFPYFFHADMETKKEYFNIVISLLETEDVDDNQRELIELAYKYANCELTASELTNKLIDMFEVNSVKYLEYDGTDENINGFCFILDISSIIIELLKRNELPNDLKIFFLKKISNVLIGYIKTVPYKDYTSYFDDISADLFRSLVPFCKNISQKFSLLNMLILRRQPITYIHSIMVQKITLLIAKEIIKKRKEIFLPLIKIGYDTDDKLMQYLGDAALYHDIGKCLTVGVINLQNRPLTDLEFKYIRMHPSKSKLLLNNDKDFDEFYDIMEGHHKSYDGLSGYPKDFDNVNSKYKIAIDLISIADSIDAATDVLGRNYTNGKNFKELAKELVKLKGTRYNPVIVDFIISNSNLMKELDAITGKERSLVYYDVYKEIIK